MRSNDPSADEDRYGPDDSPDTSARATEVIEAEDGPVSAKVTIEVDAPDIEPAGVVCDVLASTNRSVVHTVFSGDGQDIGAAGPDPPGDEDDGEDDGGRLMDWGGS